jgi:hypothetical protein
MDGSNLFLIQVIAAVQRLMHQRVHKPVRSGEDGLFSKLARSQTMRAPGG